MAESRVMAGRPRSDLPSVVRDRCYSYNSHVSYKNSGAHSEAILFDIYDNRDMRYLNKSLFHSPNLHGLGGASPSASA